MILVRLSHHKELNIYLDDDSLPPRVRYITAVDGWLSLLAAARWQYANEISWDPQLYAQYSLHDEY